MSMISKGPQVMKTLAQSLPKAALPNATKAAPKALLPKQMAPTPKMNKPAPQHHGKSWLG